MKLHVNFFGLIRDGTFISQRDNNTSVCTSHYCREEILETSGCDFMLFFMVS